MSWDHFAKLRSLDINGHPSLIYGESCADGIIFIAVVSMVKALTSKDFCVCNEVAPENSENGMEKALEAFKEVQMMLVYDLRFHTI